MQESILEIHQSCYTDVSDKNYEYRSRFINFK
jgi:hypothetical protein